MKTIQIIDHDHALPSPLQAVYCDTFLCRLRGLMFRSRLDPQQGLLLVEKRDSRIDTAIHMLFVYMDLAVIWINADGIVVDKVLARSWRLAYTPRQPARFILEIIPQRLDEFSLGDRIEFRDA